MAGKGKAADGVGGLERGLVRYFLVFCWLWTPPQELLIAIRPFFMPSRSFLSAAASTCLTVSRYLVVCVFQLASVPMGGFCLPSVSAMVTQSLVCFCTSSQFGSFA